MKDFTTSAYMLSATIILLSFCTLQVASAQNKPQAVVTSNTSKSNLSESQKIEQLIICLRGLEGAAFIRNGSKHTPAEAAEHLQSKWKKHGAKIKTAEDFIEHLATKSSMSGDVYMIRYPDGRQVPTAELLHKELEKLKLAQHD